MDPATHICITVYSSSHLTDRHTVLAPFLEAVKHIPDKSLIVRAVGGKRLDSNVLKMVSKDIQSWPNLVLIFLLGDNNVRAPRFRFEFYMEILEKVFQNSSRIPNGCMVWNGLIPNPKNWGYQRPAMIIDQKVAELALLYPKVETVNLKIQFRDNQFQNEYTLLRDGVHFNHHGGFAMANLLANQVKACVAMIRLKIRPENFSIFDHKPISIRSLQTESVDELLSKIQIEPNPDPIVKNGRRYFSGKLVLPDKTQLEKDRVLLLGYNLASPDPVENEPIQLDCLLKKRKKKKLRKLKKKSKKKK